MPQAPIVSVVQQLAHILNKVGKRPTISTLIGCVVPRFIAGNSLVFMERLLMLSDYIIPTLITLCILLVAWYFLGMWFNRRRGIQLARSLRDRLNALGAEELT